MKLVSTYFSADKIRTSDVSYVDEQTFIVQFYTKTNLDSYAYYDTLEHAEKAAFEYTVE